MTIDRGTALMLIFNRFDMASANYNIDVNAPPESVFDLISRIEGFKNYSKLIRDIKEVSSGRYLWRVEYLGASCRVGIGGNRIREAEEVCLEVDLRLIKHRKLHPRTRKRRHKSRL